MSAISAISPYTYTYNYNSAYNSIYKSTGTDSATSALQQLLAGSAASTDSLQQLFGQLQLWDYARSQAVSRQSAYRAQIQGFASATQSLAASAGAIASQPAQADLAKTTAAVKTAVEDYNTLIQSLQAGNLTTRGRGLLSSLQAAADVREEELNAIGIAYNRTTGELTVDDLKLKQAVTTDYANVRETLGGEYGLGTALKQLAGAAAQEPVGEYLAYNPLATSDYATQLSGSYLSAYYSAYSQGLLLDLMA
jgi:hypothetical protein